MMKWMYAVAAVALLFAAQASAFEVEEEAEDGEARLGYITVASDGSTSLTFNATSIQNAVILGLFILVLGALLLPLFGIFGEEEEGYGYGYEQTGYQTGYEQPSSGYNTFSKRSAEMLGPVLDALSTAYKKYEE
jgi:opacity protein-like surface antigen